MKTQTTITKEPSNNRTTFDVSIPEDAKALGEFIFDKSEDLNDFYTDDSVVVFEPSTSERSFTQELRNTMEGLDIPEECWDDYVRNCTEMINDFLTEQSFQFEDKDEPKVVGFHPMSPEILGLVRSIDRARSSERADCQLY